METGKGSPSATGAAASEDAAPGSAAGGLGARGHEAVLRIPVSVRIVLGAARMPVSKLMSLTRGSIIPLDRKVGDMVDIVVNERMIARGEVVVLDEDADRFGVTIREIVASSDE